MNHLLEAALRYADLGYHVLPLRTNSKLPQTKNGVQDASIDTDVIRDWWTVSANANVGISTKDLFVVDVDFNAIENEEKLLKYLKCTCGGIQFTSNGGRHYIFKQTSGKSWRNTAGKIANGVDTRGVGGYIVVAPSVVNGNPYSWCTGFELCKRIELLPEPPGFLVDMAETMGF